MDLAVHCAPAERRETGLVPRLRRRWRSAGLALAVVGVVCVTLSRTQGELAGVASVRTGPAAVDIQLVQRAKTRVYGETREGQAPVALNCPKGQTIHAIDFASFGLPTNDKKTGPAVDNACHAALSMKVVKTRCLGQSSCRLGAAVSEFGMDPCPGTKKRLIVAGSCGAAEAGQYAYKGCFRHETQNVIARWTNDATTWAECRALADADDATFFVLEHPQGYDKKGAANCGLGGNYKNEGDVKDKECAGELDGSGHRLGSGFRMAVYESGAASVAAQKEKTFSWAIGGAHPESTDGSEWSPCAPACGTSKQMRALVCVRSDGVVVDDHFCEGAEKPDDSRPCTNYDGCTLAWSAGGFADCTPACGPSLQRQSVACVQKELSRVVKDSECTALGLKRPPATKRCDDYSLCKYGWEWEGEWEGCDAVCGAGKESRTLHCIRSDPNGNAKVRAIVDNWSQLPAHFRLNDCKQRPDTARECWRTHGCEFNWVAADWSTCSAQCGQKAQQNRNVVCQATRGGKAAKAMAGGAEKYVDDAKCDSATDTKPPISQECNNDDLVCSYKWDAREWSKCPDGCGYMTQVRPVVCAREDGSVVPDRKCSRNAGVHKRALEFDDNGFVSVDGFPSIKTPTYEFWMRPHELRKREEVMLHKDKHISFKWADDKLAFWIHTAALGWAIAASYPLDADTARFMWTHVAGTFDGKQANLYVNGDRVASVAFKGLVDLSPAPLLMGASAANAAQFNGLLSNVRVWETVRTPLEIKGSYDESLKGTEQDLVAMWPLDENDGIVAHDGRGRYSGKLMGDGLKWVDNTACDLKADTTLRGQPLNTRPLLASSPSGCAALCSDTDGCVAWTYVPAGAPGSKAKRYRSCRLIAAGDFTEDKSDGSVSGVKAACRVDSGRPVASRRCDSRSTCVFGRRTPPAWSDPQLRCSASCGEGVRRREAPCVVRSRGSPFYGQQVGDSFCAPLKDATYTQLQCTDDSACVFEWATGPWREKDCADACGASKMPREVWCEKRVTAQDPSSAVGRVADAQCDKAKRPPATKSCYSVQTCDYSWGSEDWGECEPSCGNSVKKRRVWCLRSDDQQVAPAECKGSSAGAAPAAKQTCYSYATCTYAWHYKGAGAGSCSDGRKNGDETAVDCGGSCPPCTVDGGWSAYGPWSKCDATCGNGVMTSKRTCTNPPPANGGRKCEGKATLTKKCKLPACQVDFGGTCDYTSGAKRYEVSIRQGQSLVLTTIPPGKANVAIKLDADADIDIRLETEMGEPLISYTAPNKHWGSSRFQYHGMSLKGCTDGCSTDQDMVFHGDGKTHTMKSSTDYSSEYIYIKETSQPLVLKVNGYEDGHGTVSYEFDCVENCAVCNPIF